MGAVSLDNRGRLLVVRRGQPPASGRWSLPGGRVEAGESPKNAVRREVREETSLQVAVGEAVGTVEIPVENGLVYDVTDYWATVIGDPSSLRPGDDAAAAAWVSRQQLDLLDCSPGLLETLDRWNVWSGCPGRPTG